MKNQSNAVVVQAKEPQEITRHEERGIAALPVETFIMKAIENNLPIETMERLLAMRKELRAEQAKEAYDAAMSRFQGECPVIKKLKEGGKTKSGGVAYYYAPLDSIVDQVKHLLGKNGLSYAIKTETTKESVNVTVISKHEMGHSEETHVEVPMGTKTEIMSAPQVVAATITFATRMAFRNAFGIVTGDEDLDERNARNKKEAAKTPAAPAPAAPVKVENTPKQRIMMLMKTNGLEPVANTAEAWKDAVKRAVGIDLVEENYEKIIEVLSHTAGEPPANV